MAKRNFQLVEHIYWSEYINGCGEVVPASDWISKMSFGTLEAAIGAHHHVHDGSNNKAGLAALKNDWKVVYKPTKEIVYHKVEEL